MPTEESPAFPVLYGQTNGADGLTKREYFAGQALAGLLANSVIANGIHELKMEAMRRGQSAMQFQDEIEFPALAKAAIAIAGAVASELEAVR